MKTFSLILGMVLLMAPWASAKTSDQVVSVIEKDLKNIRLDRTDLRLPGPPDLKGTVSHVKDFFKSPLEVPLRSSLWADEVEAATRLSDLLKVSFNILYSTNNAAPKKSKLRIPKFPLNATPEWRKILTSLYRSIHFSQTQLNKAIENISEKDRKEFLSLLDWSDDPNQPIKQEISPRRIKEKYAVMENFDEEALSHAARDLLNEMDLILPQLLKISSKKPFVWKTPLGRILIKGLEANQYKADDYKDTLVLIDLGGNNSYEGPVAGALAGQIRIVVDLGEDISIKPTKKLRPNAGSGVFGIGLLYLPNKLGTKQILSPSFSQGTGIAGIGGLYIHGTSQILGDRYVQGAGSYGVGLLLARDAQDSEYRATRMGQGLGLVRGSGIFNVNGNNAKVTGGLIVPDPREPLGSISMCQGVGYGRRAYSGGGIGMAVMEGDGIQVQGSYFAQGVGYWHSLGVFRMKGNNSTLQARRYDQGSGVHYAFGHFELHGDDNRVLNWGVGPAYGWDQSFGSAFFVGNNNELQASWGTVTAAIGSLSFSSIQGNNNKLLLPEYGNANFVHNRFAYGTHLIDGENNLFQSPELAGQKVEDSYLMKNPWTSISMKGVRFIQDLKLEPPIWPKLEQEKPRQRAMADLQKTMKEADQKEPEIKLADLLDVAAAFSVDKTSPKQAFQKLLQLPPSDIPKLVEIIDPVAVDQLIHVKPIFVSYGELALEAVLGQWDSLSKKKKRTFLNFVSHLRPSKVIPLFIEKLDGPNRASVILSLGHPFNSDTGLEPGMRTVISSVVAHLKKPKSKKLKETAMVQLNRFKYPEAYGLVNHAFDVTAEDRLEILDQGPEDVTGTMGNKGADALLDLLLDHKEQSINRLQAELDAIQFYEPQVRTKLQELIKSTDVVTQHSCLVLLGQLAHSDDVGVVLDFLTHKRAALREAAGVALARMGSASVPPLKKLFMEGDSKMKALIIAALPHAGDRTWLSFIPLGLKDKDPWVRRTTIAAVSKLSPLFKKERQKWVKKIKRHIKREEDISVQLTGQWLR